MVCRVGGEFNGGRPSYRLWCTTGRNAAWKGRRRNSSHEPARSDETVKGYDGRRRLDLAAGGGHRPVRASARSVKTVGRDQLLYTVRYPTEWRRRR